MDNNTQVEQDTANQAQATANKKKTTIPDDLRHYYDAKRVILKDLFNKHPETYERLREVCVSSNKGLPKFLVEKGHDQVLSDYFEAHQGTKAIRVMYDNEADVDGNQYYTGLLAELYTVPPVKCPICKQDPQVNDDGTVSCETATCIIGKMSKVAESIEQWNAEMSPVKK